MVVRVIVADESETSCFDLASANGRLSCVGKVENLAARPRDQDLESDRPGRSFNSVSGQRSAMDGDRSARRIAEEIDRGRNAHG